MGILVKKDIQRLLESERLVITPLLDPKEQIGEAAVDLRLGNEFISMRRPNLGLLDATVDERSLQKDIERYQERVRIAYHKPFVLHPRQFVLGASLEYLALPNNMAAQVIGRSSWGRLGLIIATATAVAPSFKGCITLELVNHGEVPLVLYPGMRIAQLVLETTSGKAHYDGRYECPTGPQFSRIHRDRDMKGWGPAEAPNRNSKMPI